MADKESQQDGRLHIRLPSTLLEKVKEKAGMIPISRIVRRLLEKWVEDKIDLD